MKMSVLQIIINQNTGTTQIMNDATKQGTILQETCFLILYYTVLYLYYTYNNENLVPEVSLRKPVGYTGVMCSFVLVSWFTFDTKISGQIMQLFFCFFQQ